MDAELILNLANRQFIRKLDFDMIKALCSSQCEAFDEWHFGKNHRQVNGEFNHVFSLYIQGITKVKIMRAWAVESQWPDRPRQSPGPDGFAAVIRPESRPEHSDQSFGPVARHCSDL